MKVLLFHLETGGVGGAEGLQGTNCIDISPLGPLESDLLAAQRHSGHQGSGTSPSRF